MTQLCFTMKPFGRPRRFKNAEELWQAFLDYLTWSENNPMQIANERCQKNKLVGVEKMQKREEAVRPLSLVNFRYHAGIKRDWATFKKEYAKRSQDFCGVLRAIEELVVQQQIDNALVGNYKENLVARLNNLHDTVEQKVSASVETRKGMSIAEAREILEHINEKI